MVILLIVAMLLLCGGGRYYYGRGNDWRAPHYGSGLLRLVVIVLVILWFTGHLGLGMIH